jgi:hypothetical protein
VYTMLTDAPPRTKTKHKLFLDSERLQTLPLPPDEKLTVLAASIETAMNAGAATDVRGACDEFLKTASDPDADRVRCRLIRAYARFLRVHRRTLSPRERNSGKAARLGARSSGAVANRLAAYSPRQKDS